MLNKFVAYEYRDETIMKRLEKLWDKRWPWLRKADRDTIYDARNEIYVLRKRLALMTVEVAEWRLKVGGAQYATYGPNFMSMVEQGIRDRVGDAIAICDDDYKGP